MDNRLIFLYHLTRDQAEPGLLREPSPSGEGYRPTR